MKKRFRIIFMMLWCFGQFRVQHFLMFYVENAKITAEAPAQLVRCIVGNLSLLIKHMIWGTFVFLRLFIQTLIVPVKFLMMRVQERKLSVPQIKNKTLFSLNFLFDLQRCFKFRLLHLKCFMDWETSPDSPSASTFTTIKITIKLN